MQADIFEDLCTSIWDKDDVGNFPSHTRDIAKLLNPKSIGEVPGMGAFAVIFPDGSIALCGARGSSVIATFHLPDHADPAGHDEAATGPTWDGFLTFLQPDDAKRVQTVLMEATNPNNPEDVEAVVPYLKSLDNCM